MQISSVERFGGGERHLTDLVKGLSLRGHKIFVCLRPNAEWKNRLSFLPEENLFELRLRNSLDIFSARKIVRIIREKNIEIVHAHAARDYPIAALAAQIAKIKLVLTRHLLSPLNALHKFLLPKDTVFIAVAKTVREKLLEQKLLPPEKVRLIRNGIDTLHFRKTKETTNREKLLRELKLPVGNLLVGIAGAIARHKGQTDFVRAAALVLRQFPATEFVIIGRNDSAKDKYRKRLEKLIEELGLQNKIHFLGWFADVAPVFSVLDVFVSASRAESFGLAIVEAMASACAVVAAETDGAKEIIENNETGKLVPIGNPKALAEAVSEFLQDEAARKTYGEKAQKSAIEKFDIEKMIAETEALYKEILTARVSGFLCNSKR